jgi:uncharacterized membrane protein
MAEGRPQVPAPPHLAAALQLPLQLLLGLAYPFMAHAATTHGGSWPLLALADLVVLVLVGPLLRRSLLALAVLVLCLAGLVAVQGTAWPELLLLAPPVLFTGWVAWWFWRSLGRPEGALVERIVAALYARAGWPVSAGLRGYARRLTLLWALVLGLLTLANAGLALCAVPGGVLHALGYQPWLQVSPQAWSWFANLLNYGVVGGLMAGEFIYRKRRFPQRPYRNAWEFARQMAGLGAGFWRQLLG